MTTCHPLRQFRIIAIGLIEVSNTSHGHIVKAADMGDLFSRCVSAVPVQGESTASIAIVILDEWILRFPTLEMLLSGRGKYVMSDLVKNLCGIVGTRKIFTSPYHPHTEGIIECFNGALMKDSQAFVCPIKEDRTKHISMSCF